MAEINPLAILDDGKFVALDAKVIIDDNALFRHEDIKKYEELSELESHAKKNGFSFVELDGDIAIIGNGAGISYVNIRYGYRCRWECRCIS